MITAGQLRDRINLARPTRTPNDSGGGTSAPVSYLDTYAQVVELSSDPELIAQGEDVKQVVRFRIRYRPQLYLHNGDILTWRNIAFTVNNFKVDPLRTYIELFVTAAPQTSQRQTNGT